LTEAVVSHTFQEEFVVKLNNCFYLQRFLLLYKMAFYMNSDFILRKLTTKTIGRFSVISLAALVLLSLSACGDGKKDKGATQTAAKVNKEEITVHQINFALQQQRGLRQDQADAAGKQALERLIDQELAMQKALELKMDREPKVVQQIESARREIIARAYLEKTSETVAKPTDQEIKAYYDGKPGLFKERRIYSLQEIQIAAKAEQIAALRTQLQGAKSIDDFVAYLKKNSIRFVVNQMVRPAEQLPLNMLETFAKLKDGQAMLVPNPSGAQVIVVAGSRSEPVDAERAKPAVEQFLLNEAKRKRVESDLKALRAGAQVEYVGKFAASASSAATEPAEAAPEAPLVVKPGAAASGGISAEEIAKGMGLK
jgi:EpsD family peptidyl-prolyl cis-trans isomerase